MNSLTFRIVAATTVVFLIALAGTFAIVVADVKYGFFRVQRNSLSVQAEALAKRARLIEGVPTLGLGRLEKTAGRDFSYALLDAEGRVVRSYGLAGVDVSPETLRRYGAAGLFGFSLERILDRNGRDPVLLIFPHPETGEQRVAVTAPARDGLLVQVSMPVLDGRVALDDVIYTFSEAGVIAAILPFVIAIVAILFIVRYTLRPVRDVSRQATEIGPTTLDRRLSLERLPPEMRGVVLAFNDLLARLDTAWRSQRDFTANAAHELRTPIAALRAEVEAKVPTQARAALADQFDKVARLLAQLLALAEADSRRIEAAARLDLMALAREVVTDLAPSVIGSGRDISLDWDGMAPGTMARGDPGLAEIALRNLVDNAARHSAPGSEIRVLVAGSRLRVVNSGSDLSDEARRAMFERFWKKDRRSSGSGLGLSIVDTVMRRLGGGVEVDSGDGVVTFTLVFRSGSDAVGA